MNKKKLIELRCRAWGITVDEYYCNQCSDFSLEDMTRAYRRGKNKGRAELEETNNELKGKLVLSDMVLTDKTKRIKELKEANKTLATMNNSMWVELEKKRAESQGITNKLHQLIKAKELLKRYVKIYVNPYPEEEVELRDEAEQFISEVEK